LLNEKKRKLAVFALLDINANDNDINDDTIVELASGTTKKALLSQGAGTLEVVLSDFLAGVFLYTTQIDNEIGKNAVKYIDSNYINSFNDKQEKVIIIESTQKKEDNDQKELTNLTPQSKQNTHYDNVTVVTTTRPLQPSDFFRGRDKIIAEVKQRLTGNAKLMLLNGMGGISKTEVCRKLFHKAINDGLPEVEKVGWVTFSVNLEQSLFNQFTEIKQSSANSSEYLQQAKLYANDLGGKLLLFIDNANDMSAEDTTWLSSLNCKVILTSRRRTLERLHAIEVDKLSIEDCRILYRWHSEENSAGENSNYKLSYTEDDSPNEDLDAIITLADRHTLAIELLAKTQIASGRNVCQMHEVLETVGFSLAAISESISYTHNPEIGVWDKAEQIFIEQFSLVLDISGFKGEALRVLQLFSLLAPEPIFTEKVKSWFDISELSAANALVDTGWVFRGRTGEENLVGYSMHPLVSSVVRYRALPEYSTAIPLVSGLKDDLELSYLNEFAMKIPLLSHANSVIEAITGIDNNYADLINNTANVLTYIPDYQRALVVLGKSEDICRTYLSANDVSLVATYQIIGYTYYCLGEHTTSLEYCFKALEIRE
jgi:tetratricopeptide (TPR) repeat protein